MTVDIAYTIDCPSVDILFETCVKTVESLSEKVFMTTEVSIVVMSPQDIQQLNQQYRDKDAVTDVLSFPQWEEKKDIFAGSLLGEIFICYQRAQEQAIKLEHSLDEELATLCVHGLWHLQGYDHISETEYALMKNKEQQTLELLRETHLF